MIFRTRSHVSLKSPEVPDADRSSLGQSQTVEGPATCSTHLGVDVPGDLGFHQLMRKNGVKWPPGLLGSPSAPKPQNVLLQWPEARHLPLFSQMVQENAAMPPLLVTQWERLSLPICA